MFMDEFLWRALAAGMVIASVAGPLGSFVVWRRMAYFGDTVAHSALLGVVVGMLFHLHLTVGIVLTALMVALLVGISSREKQFSADTLLGILSHGTLSIGLVMLALTERARLDLNSYLFGDILGVSWQEVGGMAIVALAALVLLMFYWRRLMLMTISEDIARVEGVPTAQVRLVLMVIISLVVAIALKIVGILLITSLLIIPAATARSFARTPTQMALLAAFIGMLAVAGGLFGSLQWDTPSGPSIVVAGLGLFVAAYGVSKVVVKSFS